MACGAVQQNGIFSTPQHLLQSPHMDPDLSDSRKRPLETPTEASSTKRSNTGGKIGQRSGLLLHINVSNQTPVCSSRVPTPVLRVLV